MSLDEMDKSIQNTEFWKLMTQKSKAEMTSLKFVKFVGGVNTICAHGIALSKDIMQRLSSTHGQIMTVIVGSVFRIMALAWIKILF